jgi:hypothetical protein
MMRFPELTSLVLLAMAAAADLCGQDSTRVELRSTTFGRAVLPTLAVTFNDADPGSVERYWRGALKEVSHKVSGGRELTGRTARVPTISADTLRILVRNERSRGLPQVTVHVAFLTVDGPVGGSSDGAALAAARNWVRNHAATLRRELATAALKDGERGLAAARRHMRTLEKEHERATEQRQKNQVRRAENQESGTLAEAELQAQQTRITERRQVHEANPSDEGAAELKELEREVRQKEKAVARAARHVQAAERREASLEQLLERNAKAREQKAAELERSEAEVERLRSALESIR